MTPRDMNELSTEALADLIHRKRTVLAQLREVGRRQVGLVDSGDIAALLRLLSAKQHLVDALGAIEQRLKPFRTQAPSARLWSSVQLRETAAREAEECTRLLAEVVAIEEQQEQAVIARRDSVGEQLRRVHSAAGVAGAYQASHGPVASAMHRASVPVPQQTVRMFDLST